MSKYLLAWTVITACSLASVRAGEPEEMGPHTGSSELERVKALEGTWKGMADGMGEGPREVTVNYHVTAAGSAVVETMSPGTPEEMVTVYHDKDGELCMTHYCMLGNQPHMSLDGATDSTVTLALDGSDGLVEASEPHMHALTITFEEDGQIEHAWSFYKEGAEAGVTRFALTRVD